MLFTEVMWRCTALQKLQKGQLDLVAKARLGRHHFSDPGVG